MASPTRLRLIDNIPARPRQFARGFRDLSPESRKALHEISLPVAFHEGATIFAEGQPARSLFILASGLVKLSASSPDGKIAVLRFAEAEHAIGLPSIVSGGPYQATATAIEGTQANLVPRTAFLHFMETHSEVAVRVAEALGELYQGASAMIKTLGFSISASQRLARFLLEWSERRAPQGNCIQLPFTHDALAEIIGSSRETVTRILAEFKKERVAVFRSSTILILNRDALHFRAGISNGM